MSGFRRWPSFWPWRLEGGVLFSVARGWDESVAGVAPAVAVHRVAADCSAVLGHGGRLRNSPSFGGSDSPRRPLAHGEGQPAAASAPRRHRRRLASHRIIPGRLARGVPRNATVRCHERGETRVGVASGRAPGLVLRSTVPRWARDSALRHLTGRSCLSAAAKGREASSPAPPRREHRKAVPRSGSTKPKPSRRPSQP